MLFLSTNTQKIFNSNKHKILIVFMLFFSTLVVSCGEETSSNKCDNNPCADSPIPNKNVCKLKGSNDFECVCEEGYEADEGRCKALVVDSCNPNPCKEENKTNCKSTGTSIKDFICSCNDSFELNDAGVCVRKVGTCDENACTETNKNVCTVVGVGYDCSCNVDTHEEGNICVFNTKRVSCKSNNPNKPANSNENLESVDVSWNEDSQKWEDTPYCSWTCFDEYKGDDCNTCNTNYVMQNNSCIFDCSADVNSEPNSSNNSCVCKAGYQLKDGSCVETVDPCQPNPCLNSSTNKTRCIANSQTADDYSCNCEDTYSENEAGICIEISEVHIRAVAANITTGNCSSYYSLDCSVDSDGEGMRILQGLKPNVIMIQEFKYKNDTDANFKEMIEAIFQDPGCASSNPKRCFYSIGDRRGNTIPNGVISKFPILEHGYWDDPNIPNRDLDWAILDIPGDKDLFTISVHLHTKPSSDQVEAAQVIAQKVSELKASNPDAYYYMVGGDFNGSSSVSYSGFGKYQGESIFDVNAPKPKGEDGSTGTSASRGKILDWILTSFDLGGFQVSSKFCSTTNANDCKYYSNGLVFDTRDFYQSELDKYFSGTSFGGQTLNVNDSDGVSMQHQAVVKDFKITF